MNLEFIYNRALNRTAISMVEAMYILGLPDKQLGELFLYANKLRQHYFADNVHLCGILNAKSGECSEDCCYCAQSVHHKTNIFSYGMLTVAEILENAKMAKENGVRCFSLVTSGRGIVEDSDFEIILEAISSGESQITAASLGILSSLQLLALRKAGLCKYHHNLESAESFFSSICTTHTFAERIETIFNAKKAGLEICSGGIIGLGESLEQRVELAFTLKALEVNSIPLNFLHPIPGTKIFDNYQPLRVEDILKTIAMFRFVLPNTILGVIGGRERLLADRQADIFCAGANCIMLGNYLTTAGNSIDADKELIRRAGLKTS